MKNELTNFLVEAKRKGYAGEDSEWTKLKNGERQFNFDKNPFTYRDSYILSDSKKSFSGRELVWRRNKAVWTMNYQGIILPSSIRTSVDEIYKFLRKSLREIPEEFPFRGPANFEDGDFTYRNILSGDLECFSGIELISKRKTTFYKLNYHGLTLK